MKLTGNACRAARTVLGWSMRDLARHARVSVPTLLKLEQGGTVSEATESALLATFTGEGRAVLDGKRPELVDGLRVLGLAVKAGRA